MKSSTKPLLVAAALAGLASVVTAGCSSDSKCESCEKGSCKAQASCKAKETCKAKASCSAATDKK